MGSSSVVFKSTQVLHLDRILCMHEHPQQGQPCIIHTAPSDADDPRGGEAYGVEEEKEEEEQEAEEEEEVQNEEKTQKSEGLKRRLGRRGGCRHYVAKDGLHP